MNAKKEFCDVIKRQSAKVKCAEIRDKDYGEHSVHYVLKVNYSQEDFEKFLNELDFDYDNGFGGQELYGTIWLEDNTWFSRGEYDGSEWWEHNVLPEIPMECQVNSD